MTSRTRRTAFDFKDRRYQFAAAARELKGFLPFGRTRIEAMAKDAESLSYRIGVTGVIKAGKSTLLNALMGREQLGTDPNPCTAAITHLPGGVAGACRAELIGIGEWRQRKKDAGAQGNEILAREIERVEARHGNVEKLLQNAAEKTFDISKVADYTTSEGRFGGLVQEVWLPGLWPDLLEQGCEILDTPGLDDPFEGRSQLSLRYLGSVDAILLALPVGEGVHDKIEKWRERWKKVPVDRVVVLATKCDTYDKAQLREALDGMRKGLSDLWPGAIPQVIPVSATAALAAPRLAAGEDSRGHWQAPADFTRFVRDALRRSGCHELAEQWVSGRGPDHKPLPAATPLHASVRDTLLALANLDAVQSALKTIVDDREKAKNETLDSEAAGVFKVAREQAGNRQKDLRRQLGRLSSEDHEGIASEKADIAAQTALQAGFRGQAIRKRISQTIRNTVDSRLAKLALPDDHRLMDDIESDLWEQSEEWGVGHLIIETGWANQKIREALTGVSRALQLELVSALGRDEALKDLVCRANETYIGGLGQPQWPAPAIEDHLVAFDPGARKKVDVGFWSLATTVCEEDAIPKAARKVKKQLAQAEETARSIGEAYHEAFQAALDDWFGEASDRIGRSIAESRESLKAMKAGHSVDLKERAAAIQAQIESENATLNQLRDREREFPWLSK